MKWVLTALFLLLNLALPVPVHASWSVIRQISAGSPNGGTFTTSAFDATGANTLFYYVVDYNGGGETTTLTDSEGNVVNCLTESNNGAGFRSRLCYVRSATVSSAMTVTSTAGGGITYSCVAVLAVLNTTGVNTILDKQDVGTATAATTLAVGSVTPDTNGQLIVSGIGWNDTISGLMTVDAPLTLSGAGVGQTSVSAGNHFGCGLAYYVQPTAGAINPTFNWTNSVTVVASTGTFRDLNGPVTVAAADCQLATIQALHNAASAGDSIQLPVCTTAWTASLIFTKPITLYGAGIGLTIIQDNIDDGSRLFDWFCGTSGNHILHDIEFEDGGRGSVFQSTVAGLVMFYCTNTNAKYKMYNVRFDHLNGSPAFAPNGIVGVAYNNTWLFSGSNTPIYCFSQVWKGVGNYGDNSWATDLTWGSSDFFFVENNTFTRDAGGVYAALDGILGCRIVFRFNTGTRVELSAHGTETGLRNRGTRAIEAYNNTFNKGGEACSAFLDLRSGSALVFRNTLDNCGSWIGSPKSISLVDDRTNAAFAPWGSADGTNTWDINHGSNPFASGTVGTGGTLEVTVSPSPGWSANQWIGYAVKKTSACSGNCSSLIYSNDADTLFFLGTDGHGAALDFSAGNTLQINRVLETLDQPGRGRGTLVENVDVPTPSPVPYDQVDDPVYEWLNTSDASSTHIITNSNCGMGAVPICRENEHYYNYTTSFDGTVGVGSGTRAARPATCTTGVTYWSTDQGSWNSSGAGGQGMLDKCTSTNTWTDGWYIPYQYPHPLSVGAGGIGTGRIRRLR